MKKTTLLLVTSTALLTISCAGGARSVAPVAIPAADFSGLDCGEKREVLAMAREEEQVLTRKQNNAALADAAGVFLVLLPVGSIFGADHEGELAEAKGEVAALERSISTECIYNKEEDEGAAE